MLEILEQAKLICGDRKPVSDCLGQGLGQLQKGVRKLLGVENVPCLDYTSVYICENSQSGILKMGVFYCM